MSREFPSAQLAGVWSATPTPFTDEMQVDVESVERMVEHHLRLGVKGLFLAGTCGEGPWMPDRERQRLVEAAAAASKGRLALAVQVTDNSTARLLDNIRNAETWGADIAVMAAPYFVLNATPDRLRRLFVEAIRESPLPVGYYHLVAPGKVVVPDEALEAIYAEPNTILVKDSSCDPRHVDLALAARDRRPGLLLLNGYEFDCVEYIRRGYDGLLLGGGIFNGHLAAQIIRAVQDGRLDEAQALQDRMNRIMWDVYGGREIACWLSGQKRLLVEMGVFSTWRSLLEYPLTDDCVAAIRRVVAEDADVLFP
jgi:4-hydroxy-tetrahydrodipicolinate synthase